MVKLLMEKELRSERKYCCIAASMSQEEGLDMGVKREMVMWYVGAYLTDRVSRRWSFEASSGDTARDRLRLGSRVDDEECDCGWPRADVDEEEVEAAALEARRYARLACSSRKRACRVLAMVLASGEELEEVDETWLAV